MPGAAEKLKAGMHSLSPQEIAGFLTRLTVRNGNGA